MTKHSMGRGLLWCVMAAVLLTGSVLPASAEDDWRFLVEIYGWGAQFQITSADGAPFEIDTHELLENLEFVAMTAAGVSKGKWSVRTDLIYIDLQDHGDVKELRSFINLDVKIELQAWIATLPVGYTLVDNDHFKLDALTGVRYLDIEVDVDIAGRIGVDHNTADPSTTRSKWDGIVGARGEVRFGDHWHLPYYADYGTGDSDYTYEARAVVGYRFHKASLTLGYKYQKWDFGRSDKDLLDDLEIKGPFVGFTYVFGDY